MTRLREIMPWDQAREVTFECEPGTLQQHKLEMLRKHGVTRLSLGVENFKPEILQYNGRAHLEEEIYRAFGWARELGFPQINIDLIAGMVGEDWDNWKDCVAKTIELAPDCVTDLPDGAAVQHGLLQGTEGDRQRRAGAWPSPTGRPSGPGRIRLRRAGEGRLRGLQRHTVVKDKAKTRFVYRDALWHGADMFGTGVASFGHVNGVHIQNVDTWEQYIEKLNAGELPLGRAFPTTERDRLIREMVLLLKTGHLDVPYFQRQVRRGYPRRVPRCLRQAASATAG